ncbi:hypothetical protein ACIP9C_15955 [Lysinibacillus sp. NPDC093210]|uniref:hypothetical protein n=1 Tax=Lysinibacillus sp. NPDC093210 TaxID=3364133 RepID=UPI00382B0EB7
MENVNIYDIIGVSIDPIYEALNRLCENEEILIGKYTIRKTNKFYEIENKNLHECFKEKENCYQFLSNLLMAK